MKLYRLFYPHAGWGEIFEVVVWAKNAKEARTLAFENLECSWWLNPDESSCKIIKLGEISKIVSISASED